MNNKTFNTKQFWRYANDFTYNTVPDNYTNWWNSCSLLNTNDYFQKFSAKAIALHVLEDLLVDSKTFVGSQVLRSILWYEVYIFDLRSFVRLPSPC